MSNSSMPGVVRDIVGNSGCDCTTLSLPPTVVDTLEGPALKRVNTILLEYARDVTLLQSKAYDAVLAAFRDS
jgi:hypothetical protein